MANLDNLKIWNRKFVIPKLFILSNIYLFILNQKHDYSFLNGPYKSNYKLHENSLIRFGIGIFGNVLEMSFSENFILKT